MVKVNDVLLMSSVLTLKTSRIVLVFINDFDYVNAAGIVVKTHAMYLISRVFGFVVVSQTAVKPLIGDRSKSESCLERNKNLFFISLTDMSKYENVHQ